MAKYFTLEEMQHSDVARKNGIDNSIPLIYKANVLTLINRCLDPIREKYGTPIYVNSGYRSPNLNVKVGGAANSLHLKGQAADVSTGTILGNQRLYRLIKEMVRSGELSVYKVINEFGCKWIHVSYVSEQQNVNQFMTSHTVMGKAVYYRD